MRHTERWLAFLRVVVGLWFLKSLLTKITVALAWGIIPLPVASPRWQETMPLLLTRYAEGHPLPAYRSFLLETVAPNPVFAHVTALGEVAIGLSLTLGLLTPIGALAGATQVLLYGAAVQHVSPSQQGFHLLLLALMLAFLFARAGRVWGVDAWWRARQAARARARELARRETSVRGPDQFGVSPGIFRSGR